MAGIQGAQRLAPSASNPVYSQTLDWNCRFDTFWTRSMMYFTMLRIGVEIGSQFEIIPSDGNISSLNCMARRHSMYILGAVQLFDLVCTQQCMLRSR